MATEYWMVERDDGVYWGFYGPTPERLHGTRWTKLKLAKECLRNRSRYSGHTWHLVHVRIRPPSERLYLAEKLAAWQPVVRAAEEMRKRWDEKASPAKQQDAQVAVVVACRKVAKEHRP
jgi:hypothetical protein